MFSLFKKNPVKKLEKEYDRILTEGMKAQRNGKIALFATLSQQAEELRKKIDTLKEAEEK